MSINFGILSKFRVKLSLACLVWYHTKTSLTDPLHSDKLSLKCTLIYIVLSWTDVPTKKENTYKIKCFWLEV